MTTMSNMASDVNSTRKPRRWWLLGFLLAGVGVVLLDLVAGRCHRVGAKIWRFGFCRRNGRRWPVRSFGRRVSGKPRFLVHVQRFVAVVERRRGRAVEVPLRGSEKWSNCYARLEVLGLFSNIAHSSWSKVVGSSPVALFFPSTYWRICQYGLTW